MKRTIVFTLLVFATILCLSFALAACGETQNVENEETPDKSAITTATTNIHVHTYSDSWAKNETYHWRIATCHTAIADYAPHSWDEGTITRQPTTTSKGIKTITCSICGATKTETLDPIHIHTCEAEWSTDDTNHWHNVTCGHDIKLDEAKHNWDSGEITKAATESENGCITYTCTICNLKKEIPIYVAIFKDGDAIISIQQYKEGDTYLTSVPTVPEKEGYSAKWESYSLKGGNVTINAVYTKKNYTVTWKNYDGSTIEAITVEHGVTPKYFGKPTRNSDAIYDYTFTGWIPAIMPATENAEYVAQYTANKHTTYTITYSVGTGEGVPESQTKNSNQALKLSNTIPTHSGYYFAGWKCFYDNRTYMSGEDFNIDCNITLYAVWGNYCSVCNGTGKEKCTNCNGKGEIKHGTACSRCNGTGKTIKSYCRYCGYSRETPFVIGTLAQKCPYCGGSQWITNSLTTSDCTSCGGNGGYYHEDCMKCVGGEITCRTCKGTKKGEIVQDSQSYVLALRTDDKTSNASVPYGQLYKLPIPQKYGYTFIGWYDAATNGKQYTDGNGVSLSAWSQTSGMMLYAHWQINYYSIVCKCKEDLDVSMIPRYYTVNDSAVGLPQPTYTKDYYSFSWVCGEDLITKFDPNVAKDITLEAKWIPIKYTITYDLNGGKNNNDNPSSYTVETIGDGVTLAPATKETARNVTDYKSLGNGNYSVTYDVTAYTFLGWYTESNFVNQVTTITPADGDVSLYAKWSETTSTTTTTTEQGYLRGGNYIYFGTYPQTQVTDSAITSTLRSKMGNLPTSSNRQKWTSYGYYINGSVSNYMWYIDLTYGGEKYRGVYFTSYRPYSTTNSSSASYSYQDDNGYNTGNVYWFRYEPIRWRILSEAGGEALIFCEMAIDSQNYYLTSNGSTRTIDGKTVYENNYQYSTIRTWLNDTFYNTAFNNLQKELILLTTVDNSARSTNPNNNATRWNSGKNTYACAYTEDYVFLLSEQEVTTTAYGFNSSHSNDDTARRKQNTDYAKCQGASDGNGYWWLRSPYYNGSYFASFVDDYGLAASLDGVDYTGLGVVPALRIKLS